MAKIRMPEKNLTELLGVLPDWAVAKLAAKQARELKEEVDAYFKLADDELKEDT
jgi:hypothetical protein